MPFSAAEKVSAGAFQQVEINSGIKILNKAIDAAGGLERFRSIQNLTIKTESTLFGAQTKTRLTVTETMGFPNRTKQVIELAHGVRTQVLNGKDSWKQVGDQAELLGQTEKREMERGLFRDLFYLFQNTETGGLSVEYLEDEILGGQTLHIVKIKNGIGDFVDLYIDSKSHLVKKKSYLGAAELGLVRLEEIYSDFRIIEHFVIPHHTIINANGRKFMESKVLKAQFNTNLSDEVWFSD